jgi:hypothetical protein
VDVKERALIDNEKKVQAERAAAAVEAVKALVESKPGPFVVHVLECGANSKVGILCLLLSPHARCVVHLIIIA